jgi:hypothetical protein
LRRLHLYRPQRLLWLLWPPQRHLLHLVQPLLLGLLPRLLAVLPLLL